MKMTSDRLHQIRQLITHPSGVCESWLKNLALEMLEELEATLDLRDQEG